MSYLLIASLMLALALIIGGLSGCNSTPPDPELPKALGILNATQTAIDKDVTRLLALKQELETAKNVPNARVVLATVEDVKKQGKQYHPTFQGELPDTLVGTVVEPLKPAGLKLHEEARKPDLLSSTLLNKK